LLFLRLLAKLEDHNEPQVACYITAPSIIVQKLACRIINSMSSLIVSNSEELVSNVISIECLDTRTKIPFPVIIAIPFSAQYRGNYRDIMVKISDTGLCYGYISPVSLEGYYGGRKGTFAEVKVYRLGVYSVISCLRKETFTVPKKGLSIKLSMDSRISLSYLAGSFNASIIVQSKVQPIDTSLLSIIKSKEDIFHSIVSTSPLVHMLHPSTQPFRKPVFITLPCPPNPDKKCQGDETDHRRPASASVSKTATVHRIQTMSASVKKHRDVVKETLTLIGYKSKEEEWTVLENISVKNIQNGLIAFEMTEHLDKFIVLRLTSTMDNRHMINFICILEEAICYTMVNVVVHHKKEDVHNAVVVVVPSKHLRWELMALREEGFRGPPEPSEEISMREGEQLILRFNGNISSLGNKKDLQRLTFHAQRKNRLELQLKEIDEFGNYCSPHYKGSVIFYKLTKKEISEYLKQPIQPIDYQHQTPVCKLPLTLPKRERIINHPSSVKKVLTASTAEPFFDKVLYWLAEELSEEDVALLFLSLPIRRSTIQLVKLKSPDNLTDQIYELLSMWKKCLPTSSDKIRLLSRHLCRSGREDLAEELKIKQKNKGTTYN
uniref:Death domain containing 1 n=1 Tax=Latimeria chalumnae TaxID=7897 RepID=H3AFU5_LATCH